MGVSEGQKMSVLKDALLYFYWKPFKKLIQMIPPTLVYPAGSLLGLAAFLFRRRKRCALEKEVEFILGPAIEARRRKSIVRKAFQVEAQKELEVLLFPILSPNNISSFARIEGIEHLDKALAGGKGVMLLFAHFGANQMIMPAIGYRGYTMCQLSAPATIWKEVLPDKKFSAMEEYSLQARTDHEGKLPVKHINIFKSIKEAFRCLQRNEVLGVAVDGGGGKERISVSFLGREALLSPGPSDLSRRTGCAVLPTFVLRDSRGRNRVIIEGALEILADSVDGNTTAATTQAFVTRLQEYVRKYPEYYISFMSLRAFMAGKGDVPLFKNSCCLSGP
jgi:phosphatidylinositol dimannoside acyltransferase